MPGWGASSFPVGWLLVFHFYGGSYGYCRETLSYIFTLRGNDFTNFSDSHSVLAALKSFPNLQSKTYLIFHIRDQLYRLRKSGKKVKLYWVPAHRGIIGNELVDRAAKSASVIGRDTQLFVPLSCLTLGTFGNRV